VQPPTAPKAQKRTKCRQTYRYFRLLCLTSLESAGPVDGERVKMALYP
jgi:hypothetical protein